MLAGPARMDILVPVQAYRQHMIVRDEVLPNIRGHRATHANVPHRTAVWQPRTELAGHTRHEMTQYGHEPVE